MSLNKLAIKIIKKYQSNKNRPSRCRHFPSCSNYGLGCYQKFNFLKATFLTTFRILRCNPFSKNYFDPIPKTKQEKNDYKIKLEAVSNIDNNLILVYNQTQNIYKLIDYIYNNNNQIVDETFYYKVDRILILIKKKIINAPYQKTKKLINQYLLKKY